MDEKPCQRCDETSGIGATGRYLPHEFAEARGLPCDCSGGCGAPYCGGEDQRVWPK